MGHPVPLIIVQDGVSREATDEEVQLYAERSKAAHTKWVTANRIAYAKNLLASGVLHNVAWTDAFERYPSEEVRKQKHRFVMEL